MKISAITYIVVVALVLLNIQLSNAAIPSKAPVLRVPTRAPTRKPSVKPSKSPSLKPTKKPTLAPTS